MSKSTPSTIRALTLGVFLVTLFNVIPSIAKSEFKESAFKSSDMVDERGFINVWTFRKDVAQVEALTITDDTEHCFPEGDDESSLTAKESKKIEQEGVACEQNILHAYAAYQKIRKSFNLAWLPVIYSAIRKGDVVAEVIMRQCETTNAIDRDKMESTCDHEEKRRIIAKKRLLKIGFFPAIDISDEMVRDWLNPDALPNQKEVNQIAAMKKLRYGALGFDTSLVEHQAKNEFDLDLMNRWKVMMASFQDVPRVFTTSALDGLGLLTINRNPTTSRCLTWGRELYCSPGGGESNWRAPNYNANEFESDLKVLLNEIDTHISQYLAKEPRWAVFLLHRIGHHEWVPEGMKSSTSLLDRSWEGTWILDKETLDWSKPMHVKYGQAVIKRNSELTQITVTADQEGPPFINVKDCDLRYSGGLTFLPELISDEEYKTSTSSFDTLLGRYNVTEFLKEAIVPFDRKKRYKQVLMQCKNAESLDSPRVRFLLLSGDVLVEVGEDSGTGRPSLRHYHRKP